MSRSRSTQGMALLALLAPIALGSCVADSVSMRITCNVAPEGDCSSTVGGLCYLGGGLNTSLGFSYFAVLRVTNGLKPRARDVPPQSEPNGVTINQLEIEVTDSAGNKPKFPSSLPNPFTVQATGYAPPGEDALVGAELLPSAYVVALSTLDARGSLGSLRLSIIARGETSGKVDVESGEWPWNIALRRVNVTPGEGTGSSACLPFEDDVCRLGQDEWTYACNPALVDQSN